MGTALTGGALTAEHPSGSGCTAAGRPGFPIPRGDEGGGPAGNYEGAIRKCRATGCRRGGQRARRWAFPERRRGRERRTTPRGGWRSDSLSAGSWAVAAAPRGGSRKARSPVCRRFTEPRRTRPGRGFAPQGPGAAPHGPPWATGTTAQGRGSRRVCSAQDLGRALVHLRRRGSFSRGTAQDVQGLPRVQGQVIDDFEGPAVDRWRATLSFRQPGPSFEIVGHVFHGAYG